MEVIVAKRQGSDREVVAERSRRQNPDRRNTNWQRGRAWATSVQANAKSEDHQDTSSKARRRGVKVQVLTRGELPRESAGEVSRGRSSEEACRKTGRAKGRSISKDGSTRSRPSRRETLGTRRAATSAASAAGTKRQNRCNRGEPKRAGSSREGRARGTESHE